MKGTNPVTIGVIVLVAGVFLWYVVGSSNTGPTGPAASAGGKTAKKKKRGKREGAAEEGFGLSSGKAKDLAEQQVYKDHLLTFYCGCPFDSSRTISAAECGYEPAAENGQAESAGKKKQAGGAGKNKQADGAAWKHIVSVRKIARRFDCWKKGHSFCIGGEGRKIKGRRCCTLPGVSEKYRRLNADLHNIAPVISELHKKSARFFPGEIEGENRQFGGCDFEINAENKILEPPDSKRGDLARTYLYLADAYGMRLKADQRRLLMSWHKNDPPDEWEKERNRRIKKIQGNGNPFIENAIE